MQNRKFIFISIGLIIILSFAIYSNSIDGGFIWDDKDLIKDNIYIKDWSYLPDIFTKHIGAGGDAKYFSYRPVQMITYMINYSLCGLDVRVYHFTNILLHILATLAIYWLISVLYGDRLLSLFSSILFVSHPIHVAAVTYMSGRADSLALIFMAVCFILYIKNLNTAKISTYALVLLTYMFALLSRENSLIFPALVLLYHYAFKKRVSSRNFFPILGVAFIYIVMRFTFLKSLVPHVESPNTLFQRLPGFFVAITNYMKIIFFPVDLHMEYGPKLFNFQNPKAILGVFILFSLLTYAFRKRDRNRLVFFSVFWFFIALLPLSNLYPIPIAYMAEHWLYIPSIGFFLLLANVLIWLYRTKKIKILAIGLITFLLVFYSSLTIRYNEYWKKPIAFYERVLKYAPDATRTLNSLAFAYSDIGRKEEAIALFKKAIEIRPKYRATYNNLGVLYYNLSRYKEAIDLYNKAIETDPNNARTYNNLGNSYSAIGQEEKAIAAYKKAIEINPNSAAAYNNLGVTYYDLDRFKEAIAAHKKTIEINPRFANAHFNLSLCYFYEKQYDLAVRYCDLAIKHGYKADPRFLEELKPYRK